LPSGYGLPPLAVLGDDGLVYPGICFDISDSPSGPTGLTKFSAGGAADGLLTMNGQTVKTYPTYFYSDGDGVNNYQLYVNVETPTAFWPYKNSAGEDVFNTTSGDQEADIS
jgi:hypothetical protein